MCQCALMWRSEGKPCCRSLPSTLLKIGSLVHPCNARFAVLRSSRESPVSTSYIVKGKLALEMGFLDVSQYIQLHVGSEDLHSDPHACLEGTARTEVGPWCLSHLGQSLIGCIVTDPETESLAIFREAESIYEQVEQSRMEYIIKKPTPRTY